MATDTFYSRGWSGVAFQEAASDPNAVATFRYVQAIAIPALPGDYNKDNIVDATDYVVWRKGLGTVYTQADYDVWRAHFGQTDGNGATLPSVDPSAAVPEPPTMLVCLMAMLAMRFLRQVTAY
jgi:hypothetical protein